MPEKDPTFLPWALGIMGTLGGILWGILTKRIFDFPKEYVLKSDQAITNKRLEDSIKDVETKVTKEIKDQARINLAAVNRVYDAMEKRGD